MFDPRTEKGFGRMGRLLRRFAFLGRGGRLSPVHPGWLGDADWLYLEQRPVRTRALLYAVLLAVLAFLAWSMVAPIDISVHGQGKVIPSSRLQVVESQDGGTVRRILVREGEVVAQGQTLVEVDPTRFAAHLGEREVRTLSLRAKVLRLEALIDGKPFELPGEIRTRLPDIASRERDQYHHERDALQSRLDVARKQQAQVSERLVAAEARKREAGQALALIREELNRTEPLLERGAVSEVEVLRLRRQLAKAQGDLANAKAEVKRLRNAVAEAREQVHRIEVEGKNRWRTDLAKALADLAAIEKSQQDWADRLRRTRIQAPVKGRIQRLYVNTPGEVIDPGGRVVEIVPDNDPLEVEARILPRDIARIHPGQPARVRISAYDPAVYGALEGEVTQISPDSLSDKEGRAFFLVRVRTHKAGFSRERPILPGMVAEVDVRTGQRTLWQYLIDPILRARGRALSEP